MDKYKFEEEIYKRIVDGILQGYKSYVREREQKRREMHISDAYAWVKGNHIDDQIARECEGLGVTFKKERAGYTWGYLQFTSEKDTSLFLIKNGKYFDHENFPGGKGIRGQKLQANNEDNYLKKLASINENVVFPTLDQHLDGKTNSQEILCLFDDAIMKSLEASEVIRLKKEHNKFQIITYEIDQIGMISSIQAWMPNPFNEKAYLVEDLTKYITSSSVDFTDVDLTVLQNDKFDYDVDSPSAIEYDIVHEPNQNSF